MKLSRREDWRNKNEKYMYVVMVNKFEYMYVHINCLHVNKCKL